MLSLLFGEVIVPPAVAAELTKLKPSESPIELSNIPAIRIRIPGNLLRIAELVASNLDPGESEAIALAEELHADLILIDERRGHRFAKQAGLNTLGALGILVQAKKAGAIESVSPLIERVRVGLDFFVSKPVEAEVLRLAGE